MFRQDVATVAANEPSNRGCIKFKPALTSLSLSPRRDHIVVVGRSFMRLVKLNLKYETLQEIIVVRPGRKKNLVSSSTSVDWHPTFFNTIATGSTNGAVVLWNLDRVGHETVKHHEHKSIGSRAAAAIHWHPNRQADPNMLLSCSQEPIIKLWDTRLAMSETNDYNDSKAGSGRGKTTEAASLFSVGSGCNDVRFSDHSPNIFAVATMDNSVQIWDVRNTHMPVHKYRGIHNGPGTKGAHIICLYILHA